MQIRSDRGWIKAGLAVLVAGVLGGGVLAAACGTEPPHKVTADGVTGPPGDSAGAQPAAAPPVTPPDDGKKDDPEVGDKIPVGDDGGSVTVSAVEDDVTAGRLFGAGEGNKYIAAEVKGCSAPNEKNISFEPAYFLLRLDDGTVHDHGVDAKKPSLDGGKIPAGKCLSGWVTFVVKEGSLPTGVIYDGSSRLTWTVPLPKNAKPTTTTTLKAGAVSASESSTSTTAKPKASSNTTTTAKSSGTTTSTTKPKSSGASSTTSTTAKARTASTTTTSPGTKSPSSTTSTTKPSGTSGTTSTTTARSGSSDSPATTPTTSPAAGTD